MKRLSTGMLAVLAALMVMAGMRVAFRNQRIIASLGTEHEILVAQAAAMGLVPGSADTGKAGFRTKKFQREERAGRSAPASLARIMDLALRVQQAGYDGKSKDLGTQKMDTELKDGLMHLSPQQIRELLGFLRKNDEIEYETRQSLATFAMAMLKERDFEAFLEICLESTDLLEEHLLNSAFAEWVRRDPGAAVAWVRKNGKARPELVNEDTKSALIVAASDTDPAFAFDLVSELALERGWAAAMRIANRANTPERRTATLAALRGYLSGLDDPQARAYAAQKAYYEFGWSMRLQGYEAAVAWIGGANLSSQELEWVADGLGYNAIRENHTEWFGWMAENLSPTKRDERISAIIGGWAKSDFHAAGSWLADAPDDAVIKPVAVRAYAEAVAPFEPVNAEQWALTLPAGESRQALLWRIHRSWPETDVAARAAFAKRHGLE